MQKKNEDDRYWMMRQVGLLTTIPLLLAVSPIIGFFIGSFLDKRFNTDPIFTIVFLVIGFIAGARQVMNVVRKASKDKKKRNKTNGS